MKSIVKWWGELKFLEWTNTLTSHVRRYNLKGHTTSFLETALSNWATVAQNIYWSKQGIVQKLLVWCFSLPPLFSHLNQLPKLKSRLKLCSWENSDWDTLYHLHHVISWETLLSFIFFHNEETVTGKFSRSLLFVGSFVPHPLFCL